MCFKDSHKGVCNHCGSVQQVHVARYYVGGVGDIYREICDDGKACQERQRETARKVLEDTR